MSFHQDIDDFFAPPPSAHSMNVIQYFIISLRAVCNEPPAIVNYSLGVPTLALVSAGSFLW